MSNENEPPEIDQEPNEYQVRFGEHIKSLRKSRGISSRETLAEMSELSVDTIGRLERGEFSPSLNTLRKLAMGLGVKLSMVFESFDKTIGSPRRFGLFIRSRRTKREMTDADLAMASGLPVATIREIEQGATSPNLDGLRKLAGGFGVRLSTLFDDFERGPFGE